ncbi:MAG: amidohydrolase family protein [Acidobacteria bacterium]|nr:amidohydrolase family protein [Acidobacteriota bacterium]
MRNRTTAVLIAGLLAVACSAPGQQATEATDPTAQGLTAFVGARIIDGTGADAIENGVLLVRDGRVEAVGSADEVPIPLGAERVDLTGRTVFPGLINTHGHVGDTLGLEGGHYSEENVLDHLALYARYGITTVNSLGGDQALAGDVRAAEGSPDLDRARLLFAGPVVNAASPEDITARVNEVAAMGPDFIKIRVDDNLGGSRKMSPEVYAAAIAAAHANELPLASHLFYLEDAKGLLEAGTDFVAHSVRDQPVDQELIDLLIENDVCYCPTLTREISTFVYEERPDFFDDPFFLAEADPAVMEALQEPDRQQRFRRTGAPYKEALQVALANLKAVSDGGATVAMGTDSGPPARFQGYFEHLELELMAEAGLTPMQILVASTGDAARCIGRDDVGTLEAGKLADFVVTTANPLDAITNTRTIESVWISGNRVPDAR